jgi:hypothetical protein
MYVKVLWHISRSSLNVGVVIGWWSGYAVASNTFMCVPCTGTLISIITFTIICWKVWPLFSVDDRAAFVFICDLNAHQSDWLGSSRTNDHGASASDFANSFGNSQFGRKPMYVSGGVLDLVMSYVADLLDVEVRAPSGSSDHMSLKVNLPLSQLVPVICFRKEVYLKGLADWKAVSDDISQLLLRDIPLDQCPLTLLHEMLLSVAHRRVPVQILCVRTQDKPWFDNN